MKGRSSHRLDSFLLLALLAGLPLLAACAGKAERIPVRMENAQFRPEELNVTVGTTVVWTNYDYSGHTVTPMDAAAWGSAGSGDDPIQWLKKGWVWKFKFTQPGSFGYYCLPHVWRDETGTLQGMTGVVHVVPASPQSEADSGGTSTDPMASASSSKSMLAPPAAGRNPTP